MTDEQKEALYILNKNTILLNIATENHEAPDRSNGVCMEIWNAFKVFNPSYPMDWGCGACVIKMLQKANEVRKEYLKFYTFPKE